MKSVIATISFLVLALPLTATALPYSIYGFDIDGNETSLAFGVNDLGHVTGQANESDGVKTAFVADGSTRKVGSLGGSDSRGYDINNRGQVVGYSTTAQGVPRAMLYENGAVNDMGTLGGPASTAYRINDSGQVVGYASTSYNADDNAYWAHAFRYSDGVMEDLGTLGGKYSTAIGINEQGAVTGGSLLANGEYHAYRWSDGIMQDLGTLGGTYSLGYDLNSTQVVGYSRTADGGSLGFLYENDQMVDIGSLGGIETRARAINEEGQVVGWSRGEDGTKNAFLYENGDIFNLNDFLVDSNWFLTSAFDISENGQISGTGFHNGVEKGFLLKPDVVAPVPEPASIALLACGLSGIVWVRYRHRM